MNKRNDIKKFPSPRGVAAESRRGGLFGISSPVNYGTYTAEAGFKYLLEVWGASGGGGSAPPGSVGLGPGGNGGYAQGVFGVSQQTALYVMVGGTSSRGSNVSGGHNGGGNTNATTVDNPGYGGGGGTDVRTAVNTLTSRIIVAGGGGGSCYDTNANGAKVGAGGAGGGTSGQNGTPVSFSGMECSGYGGTETAGGALAIGYAGSGGTAGALGIGGTAGRNSMTLGGGGGGGGYYGGGGGSDQYGGGGSGYIGGVTDDTVYGITASMQTGINTGNGKAVITQLKTTASINHTPSATPPPLSCYVYS